MTRPSPSEPTTYRACCLDDTPPTPIPGHGGILATVWNTRAPSRFVGAMVVLKILSGAQAATRIADEFGEALFDDLGPGDYLVQASAEEYKKDEVSVTLDSGGYRRVELTLKPLATPKATLVVTVYDGFTALFLPNTEVSLGTLSGGVFTALDTLVTGGNGVAVFSVDTDSGADTVRFSRCGLVHGEDSVSLTAGVTTELNRNLVPKFPDWTPSNLQIGPGWPKFQCAFSWMASDDSYGIGLTCATGLGVLPYPYAYSAGTGLNLEDGRVYIIPKYVSSQRISKAAIYDPGNNTSYFAGGTFPAGYYSGGALMRDGRVFCVPQGHASAMIYDPVADTLVQAGGVFPSDEFYTFSGAVLLPDGRVFCVPDHSTTARIYDPTTDTLTIPTGDFRNSPGLESYQDSERHRNGVLLPDGRVFCVPGELWQSNRVYDPVTDTTTSLQNVAYTRSIQGGPSPGILMPDGRVFCVGLTGTYYFIFDPVNDSLESYRVFDERFAEWAGIPTGTRRLFLMPDGRVLIWNYGSFTNAANFVIYDLSLRRAIPSNIPYTDFDNRRFENAVMLKDGRVLGFARTTEQDYPHYIFSSGHVVNPLADNYILSPYYNNGYLGVG
jgi:hypothetical protein